MKPKISIITLGVEDISRARAFYRQLGFPLHGKEKEEDQFAMSELEGTWLDICDAELRDIKARLSRLYDVLETGKLGLDDLAPRIKELKRRQDELSKNRVQVEADMVVQGEKWKVEAEVLPIVTPGGGGGIRTPDLLTASQTFSQLNYAPKKPVKHHPI